MKRILAMALALMIILGGLCVAPKQALAASNGTIETVVRYEAQADGLVVGNDTLNIPGQGGGSMAVYLTGENGLTKEQAKSVTAEATNGAAASVEAVEIGLDVYAAAVEIDTEGVELRSEFSITMTGAEGAIQHTLNCTYGMVKETVYYEDIDSYEGYREVDSAQVTEVTAYFRGKDETGLEDGNWTVLPFNVPRSTEYTTKMVDYQDEKKQICIEIKNTADADEMSFNTFAFVGHDGVLQATFMLAFKPGVDSGESGGNDEDDEDGNEGGAQICGVLIEGAEDRGFDINGFFTPENPKLTAYWRGLDGAEGGFASEAEAKQYSVEIDSKSSESVDTDIVTSSEKIENSDLYQLKIEIEIQNATSSTWIDYKICKSGVMVDGFGLSVLDGDEGNEGGNDQDQTEEEEEPIEPAVPVIGQPLSGKTAEIILDGTQYYQSNKVLFGVEEIYIYYRGENNDGMTYDQTADLTAQIVCMEGLSPKATLTSEVVEMEGAEELYQLKLTMILSNVAHYSWYEVEIPDLALCSIEMEDRHIAYSKEIEINGQKVRLTTAGLWGTTKIEDDAPATSPFYSHDLNITEPEDLYVVIGAFSGEREDSLENVSQEETWVYDLIDSIEVTEIYNDENDYLTLKNVDNTDPQKRGFTIKRYNAPGFIEVMIKINFKESAGIEAVVLTQRYSSHLYESLVVLENRPENDTVEELNKFLSEFDYSRLEDDLFVNLAPTTYTGTIVIPEGSHKIGEDGNSYHVFLRGAKNENGELLTTVQGTLEVRGFAGHQQNIRFVAPEDSSEDTIAVKAVAPYDGGLAVQGCEFIGYDMAVFCEGSYILPMNRNLFKDNKIAVYIDSGDFTTPTRGAQHLIYNSQFINNETAIYIKSLPVDIDPKDFRITKNDFINNKNDIVSEITDTYHYFYDNYYGVFNENGTDHTRGAPRYNYSNKYLQVYPAFEESVATLSDTDPLPARKITGKVKKMALPMESSVQTMGIETSSIQEERTEDLEVDLINEDDETVATWTIPAQQQAATISRLRMMRTVPRDFMPYAQIEQVRNGASVTLNDTEALDKLNPTFAVVLEDYDPTFNAAKVTLNGMVIEGAVFDPATGIVKFPVADGGTYEIEVYYAENTGDEGGNTDDDPAGGTENPSQPGTDGPFFDGMRDEEASEAPAEQTKYLVLCRKLNVRAGAGTKFERISSLSRGEGVCGKTLDNGWIEIVLSDGRIGYVCGKYVSAAEESAMEESIGRVVCRRLNVRSSAGTTGKRIGQLKRGACVTIVGCRDAKDWYKIKWNDAYAWVCASYIE